MSGLQKNAFTLKSLNDAINLRKHIIYLLERSDQLQPGSSVHDKEMQNRLLKFVVVGGGLCS
jgi:NADH dehydrogenase FAD-containing subunit